MRAASQPLVAQVDLNALIARRNSELCGLKLSGGADRTRSECQGEKRKKKERVGGSWLGCPYQVVDVPDYGPDLNLLS